MNDDKITQQMKRLLHLIAEYTKENDKYGELAIKDLPLKALIYYGIIKGVLDYDYAPMSIMYMENRRYLNVSQEGEDDLNDLRDLGLLNKIRLGTKRHIYIYSYLISPKGVEYLKNISDEDKSKIDNVIKCKKCNKIYDIQIKQEGIFFICDECNEEIDSEITDIEDVAYRSKPIKIKTFLSKGGK